MTDEPALGREDPESDGDVNSSPRADFSTVGRRPFLRRAWEWSKEILNVTANAMTILTFFGLSGIAIGAWVVANQTSEAPANGWTDREIVGTSTISPTELDSEAAGAKALQPSEKARVPSGRLFYSDQGSDVSIIRTVDLATLDESEVAPCGSAPGVSADGTMVVECDDSIAVIRSSGDRYSLPGSLGGTEPTISPDGERIVWVDANDDLVTTDRDSAALDPRVLEAVAEADAAPSFAPDGSGLVFHSRRSGHDDIYALEEGTERQFRLTTVGGDERDPVVSPDSGAIAYSGKLGDNWEIMLCTFESTYLSSTSCDASNLTQNDASDRNPTFSADGGHIVFESDRGGAIDLYILDISSGQTERLTGGAGLSTDPVVMPES